MVGNNSCGSHSLVYGSTRDHLLESKVILANTKEVTFKKLSKEEFEEKIKEVNTRIQCFLINYSRYIDSTMLEVKKGKEIDEKAIYALNDAVRTIAYIKRILE